MKKILAVVLTVCVVFGAGAAFAQHGNFNDDRRPHPMQQQFQRPDFNDARPCFNDMKPDRPQPPIPPHHGFEGRRHMHGKHGMFTPDMPKEIREKAAELAKLRIDLDEALSDKPLNKTKALEVHAKMQKLEQEIDSWKFEKKLERIENFRKKLEMKRSSAGSEKPSPSEIPAPKPEEPESEK